MISSISQDFDQQSVVRNLDYLLRKDNLELILVATDFPKEPLVKTSLFLAESLQSVYDRKVLVIDFGESTNIKSPLYQNINELDVVLEDSKVDLAKLKIYVEECRKHYDQVLVLPHIKLNREETVLPSLSYDGAIVLRTKTSLSPTTKKIITNKIQDSQITIKALLDVGL